MLYSRCVILAAALALVAAVLHATWNIVVKQTGDRFLALWAQFVFAGSFALIALIGWTAIDGRPNIAWWWSIFSGCGHLPYVMLLAKAYDKNDFSLTYPIARGAGALSAAILGLIFLGDDLSALSMAGIAIVIFGLWVLVSGQPINSIFPALGVAARIQPCSRRPAKGTLGASIYGDDRLHSLSDGVFIGLDTQFGRQVRYYDVGAQRIRTTKLIAECYLYDGIILCFDNGIRSIGRVGNNQVGRAPKVAKSLGGVPVGNA